MTKQETPEMVTWKKPNGTEITTNAESATVAHCDALGWKRVKTKG